MSNLTDLLPAGAGGKQVDFVASGTIGNGVTVALNSDGTVSTIASDGIPQEFGSAVVFETGTSGAEAATYDSVNNKIVIAYGDYGDSGKGKAVVGTISGTSISFGSPVTFASTYTTEVGIGFDVNAGAVVVVYRNDSSSNYGTAVVGTVSGTSISFGTPSVFNSAGVYSNKTNYNATAQKMLIAFYDVPTDSGRVCTGTVSGTSISFGSIVEFFPYTTIWFDMAYDPTSGNTAIIYENDFSNRGEGKVISISGTSVSVGSNTNFLTSARPSNLSVTYDATNGKIVAAYQNSSNNYGTAIVGTVSGTSISFGTAVVFESATTESIATVYNSNSQKINIFYADVGNSNYGTAIVGTVSGTSISFGSPVVFETAQISYGTAAYDTLADKTAVAYRDHGNSLRGTSIVFQNEGSNFEDFIGISDAAISDTASGSVTIKGGISTNVTGLTPNATYYVQADGTLSTTASSVLAGKALSSTSINLDYTT